jgi:hypothetical protein
MSNRRTKGAEQVRASGKRGRPSLYKPELADEICERLASGETLLDICGDENMPHERTVRRWYLDDVDSFAPRYARARELLYERWADEIIAIAEDGRNDWVERRRTNGAVDLMLNREHVDRSRLRIDSRKWLLAKLLPRKYGDKPNSGVPTVAPDARTYLEADRALLAALDASLPAKR